ncbi:Uncharacterised protein [uncultured archaeon]|nr:Uncharacterised protein [uncultured archaeon]
MTINATPPTVAATDPLSVVENFVGHWVTLVKAHEKLLLFVIVSATLVHLGSKGLNIYDKHLHNVDAQNQSQITALETKIAQSAKDLAALQLTVDANAKISEAKIAASKQKLIVAQSNDAALPLPELSAHWQDLLVLPPGSVTPQPNGTVAVTTDAAHTTVNELEKVSALVEQNLETQNELKGCTNVRAAQSGQIAQLTSDLELQKKGRAEDAKAAAVDRKKSWWNGFKWGAVAGFVGGIITLHKI